MHKFLLFAAVAFLSLLTTPCAEAHQICVLNHTNNTQDVNLLPADGPGLAMRAPAGDSACVDVGPGWQPFDYSVRDAGGESCSNKQIWPSTWLTLNGKQGEVQCVVRADDKPGLKDYSVRVTIENKSPAPMVITQGRSANCGYFEWMPTNIGANSTGGFPMRIISTGGCWDEVTSVTAMVQDPWNVPSYQVFESYGGLRCGTAGYAYFRMFCRAGESAFSVHAQERR